MTDPQPLAVTPDSTIFYKRDTSVTVAFDTIIINNASASSGNDIAALSSPDRNFALTVYVSDVNNGTTGNLGLTFTPSSCSGLSQGVNASSGSINISCSVDITIPSAKCADAHYFCVQILEGIEAIYNDSDITNNILCVNIADQKTCSPGKVNQDILLFFLYFGLY